MLIPALAGVFGITLGALLAGRNQRNQIHIERMIAAADEFSTRATTALAALYTALSRPEASGTQMDQVEELIPDVRARLPRVVLLFHPTRTQRGPRAKPRPSSGSRNMNSRSTSNSTTSASADQCSIECGRDATKRTPL